MSLKIALAVSHPIIREHFSALLSSHVTRTNLVPCVCGRELLRLTGEDSISHIVMDLNFPDVDGLDVLLALNLTGNLVPITVCLDRFDPHTLLSLHRIRPHAVLDIRSDLVHEITGSMVEAISGKPHYAKAFMSAVTSLQSDPDMPHFTCHQLELIAMFASGYDDKSVARMTLRSLHTIRSHRRTIYRKCAVTCAAALASYAAVYGIVRYSAGRVIHPGIGIRRLTSGPTGGRHDNRRQLR